LGGGAVRDRDGEEAVHLLARERAAGAEGDQHRLADGEALLRGGVGEYAVDLDEGLVLVGHRVLRRIMARIFATGAREVKGPAGMVSCGFRLRGGSWATTCSARALVRPGAGVEQREEEADGVAHGVLAKGPAAELVERLLAVVAEVGDSAEGEGALGIAAG